jgi:hypothetical protein
MRVDTDTFHPKADEISERISDAFCSLRAQRGTRGDVTLLDVHQEDAVNHVLTGTVDIDGQTYGFICEIGNWAGFRMMEWGDHEDIGYYKPPVVEPVTLIPDWMAWSEESYGFRVQVYARFLRRQDVIDKLGAYAYDRHFQPGGKVEGYYREWAAKMGGTLGHFSSLPQRIQDDVREWHRRLDAN